MGHIYKLRICNRLHIQSIQCSSLIQKFNFITPYIKVTLVVQPQIIVLALNFIITPISPGFFQEWLAVIMGSSHWGIEPTHIQSYWLVITIPSEHLLMHHQASVSHYELLQLNQPQSQLLLLLLKKYVSVYHLLHSIFSKVLQHAWKTWTSPTTSAVQVSYPTNQTK